ncbi:MAG TPA: 3-oxoacyl-[acyl-carrier-protein] reductase [Thermodesulfovibrionia bacterium]|nr:3-oxoacyl-[acyl-carrier-protein] reductase [Thermodesulfovibrionia bacterium]
MRLKDKTALITGAAQGIGRAIATQMAQEGARVAIADIQLENAAVTAKAIEETTGARAVALSLNVTDKESVAAAFEQLVNKFGSVDIVVNNAGVTRDALLLRMKDSDWDMVLDINLKGAFLCSKEAIKYMTKQKQGKIVNISSVVAFMGNPGQANYSASKAGLIGLTKTLAREYASRRITVNAVAPGFIDTPMTEKLSEKIKEELMRSIPLGMLGTPEDVANAVLFLCSSDADYVTGQVLHVNGGMYM